MVHRIRKQVIDLRLDNTLDAFRIQHAISQQYWDNVVPVLNKVFDTMDIEGAVIEVDRLEIDLGVINEAAINHNSWSNDMAQYVENQIRDLLKSNDMTNIRSTPNKIKVFQQWLYYMEHGYLPWNADPITDQFYTIVLDALTFNDLNINVLRNALLQNGNISQRIATQHPPSFVLSILKLLNKNSQESLIRVIEELFLVYLHIRQTLKIKYPLAHHAFVKNCLVELLKTAASKPSETSEKLTVLLVNKFFATYDYANKLPNELTAQLFETSSLIHEKQETMKNDLAVAVNEHDDLPENYTVNDTLDESGIYIVNSGIVLLHPFLPTFFRRLNLLEGNLFIDRNAQLRAIALLHFLSTGETKSQEYELTIVKVLCACPLEDLVEIEFELSDEQKGEAEAVLSAVIQQWTMLKNTTITGLREGFLQRPGKLNLQNDQLNLHVETNSIDILLDYLPWNLSLLKLPWMDNILKVTWR